MRQTMKTKFILSLFITMNVFFAAHAATIYHQVPFNLSMSNEDTLIINYDYTAKTGVRCYGSDHTFWIDFTYKGYQKSARLPVTLQSRVPNKQQEELADTTGQFNILMDKEKESTKR